MWSLPDKVARVLLHGRALKINACSPSLSFASRFASCMPREIPVPTENIVGHDDIKMTKGLSNWHIDCSDSHRYHIDRIWDAARRTIVGDVFILADVYSKPCYGPGGIFQFCVLTVKSIVGAVPAGQAATDGDRFGPSPTI